jgi:co-chaperonin GroES (HSP10)
VAEPIDIELESLKVYGKFLALEISGPIHQGAGQGKVVALGFEVQNYASGPVLAVGQEVLFREGTQIKFSGGQGGHEVVFVEMGDVLAVIKTPDELPGTTPA